MYSVLKCHKIIHFNNRLETDEDQGVSAQTICHSDYPHVS